VKQRALPSTWVAQSEPQASDWQRPLGVAMLSVGMTWLVLDVASATSPPGAPLLVVLVSIGLVLGVLAASRLRIHADHRVRIVMFLLGLVVALSATTWDLLLNAGHPRAALLALGVALVSGCGVAACAIAVSRAAGAAQARGAYLLTGLTITILLLGAVSHPVPAPPRPWFGRGVYGQRVNPGGRVIWAHRQGGVGRSADWQSNRESRFPGP
jgi:hypothetical protein